MLQLTLIRHAKSSWGNPDLKDFDRPLNKRGFQDAPIMGEHLKNILVPIDQLISSPAQRAITTSQLICEQLGYDQTLIQLEPHLYEASLDTLLNVVQGFDHALKHYALVAHNPGMSELADYFDSGKTGDLPTCAVASFTFDLDNWQAVGRGTGRLVLFEYPKKLAR